MLFILSHLRGRHEAIREGAIWSYMELFVCISVERVCSITRNDDTYTMIESCHSFSLQYTYSREKTCVIIPYNTFAIERSS